MTNSVGGTSIPIEEVKYYIHFVSKDERIEHSRVMNLKPGTVLELL